MAESLPLLVFPNASRILPPRGKGFPTKGPHFPKHSRQVVRLTTQIETLKSEFHAYKANISASLSNFEPETVLVIEIAGSVDKFKQAVEAVGLEWLGEWEIEDIQADEDFYEPPKIGVTFFQNKIEGITTKHQSKQIFQSLQNAGFIDKQGYINGDILANDAFPSNIADHRDDIILAINIAKKSYQGRLFLSLANETSIQTLLRIWEQWKNRRTLSTGQTKWRDIFNQLRVLRRWGIEESLHETGMMDRWRDLLDPLNPAEEITCQIELFYRQNLQLRKQNEEAVSILLKNINGQTMGAFLDLPEIGFHAVKAKIPVISIRKLLANNYSDIQLFKFAGIMYFRPTGQSIVSMEEAKGETYNFSHNTPSQPPIVAILDGVPNLQHEALKDRILFDDPNNLASEYLPGERKHGTSMASLVIHGELSEDNHALEKKIYFAPVMQPNINARDHEHFPEDVFYEDRIHRAVKRMFDGEGSTPAQAPHVKIINLSLGDLERPFIHIPSPWAKLLDWLSWKYRVLFCVSTGNFLDDFDIGMTHTQFTSLSDSQKTEHYLKAISLQLSRRRILSPAESLNALTVGALHADSSEDHNTGNYINLLPNDTTLYSPISRFGHGFKRSVKPEIMFPGGRQLYQDIQPSQNHYRWLKTPLAPGQKVAYDSNVSGETSKVLFTRGTSNATALATRSGARIYEVLAKLQTEQNQQIPENLTAVLIKALLVHGAQHPRAAKQHLESALRNKTNSKKFKEVVSRYFGYGSVDIERVLACTEQRATVIGYGEIKEGEIYEYRFPVPYELSEFQQWRRIVVTLAWFSPINPSHKNLREAKLALTPANGWDDVTKNLKTERQDADHNQVLRGTIQHEIFEGQKKIQAFQDGHEIKLHISCKKDATESLDDNIPYGLAVTLELAEGVGVSIYEHIRTRLQTSVQVR